MGLATVAKSLRAYAGTPNEDELISYRLLRKAVGLIGMLLPIVLVLGNLLVWKAGFASSISSYYHTEMRDVFVGAVCAIAVFMLAYRGPERQDDIAGDLACIFAIGVALFPTTQAGEERSWVGVVHLVCAAGLFLTLAFFCLVLFTKWEETAASERKRTKPSVLKKKENRYYTACGWIILGCIALIAAVNLVPDEYPIWRAYPVLVLEAVAVFVFGVAWLRKGMGRPKGSPAAIPLAMSDEDDQISTQA